MSKLLVSSLVAAMGLSVSTTSFADVGAEMNAEAEGSADVGAQMDAEGSAESDDGADKADEADDDAEAAGSDGPAAGVFAAPSGQNGAGLTLSPEQKIRAYAELGFHTQDAFTSITPILGGGYKVLDFLEVELVLPMAYASYDVFDVDSGDLVGESSFLIGNPYLGANYLGGADKLRYKVGAGLTLPLAPADEAGHFIALFGAAGMHGYQEYQYWLPDTLSIVTPSRIEWGDDLVIGGEVQLGIHIPTGDNQGDTETSIALAPGVAYWLSDKTLVGGRLPFFWLLSEEGDNAQLAVEPYFRHYFSNIFLMGRFTLNIDEPGGFSFDDGKLWGLHLGAGATF